MTCQNLFGHHDRMIMGDPLRSVRLDAKIPLVPEAGIEPARAFWARGILSPLRLPIPPLRRDKRIVADCNIEVEPIQEGRGTLVVHTQTACADPATGRMRTLFD